MATCEAIPLKDGAEWLPTEANFAEWGRLFPMLDMPQEFRNMRAWCIGNPNKQKTKKGIKKFVSGWLTRSAEQKQQGTGTGKRSRNVFNSFQQNSYDYADLEREFEQDPVNGA